MNQLRQILGSFRILSRRAGEIAQPGLRIWAGAGEQAAARLGREVGDLAHKNEVTALEHARELREITADGVVTPAEAKRLARMPAALERCADRSHDITEVVRL